MDLGLDNRVAFVAGASSGLGKSVAMALAREGCRVAMCSRDLGRIEDGARSIAEGLDVNTSRFLPLACDVTSEEDVREAVKATIDRWGQLNVLVTNAGGPPAGEATDFSASDFEAAVQLNLMSTIYLCTHAVPHLRAAAQGDDALARIIMITSVAAKQPVPTLALSNTARAGVQGYAKSLAHVLGPDGITVNTVLPGHTRTERLKELAASIQERTGQSYEEVEDGWAAHSMLGRIGTPEEFAATVTFLASKSASYLTGIALPIDGGRTKHLL